jgi:hypothetical protein
MKVEHRLCANFPYSSHVPRHKRLIAQLTCDALCSKFRLLLIFESAPSELSIWKSRHFEGRPDGLFRRPARKTGSETSAMKRFSSIVVTSAFGLVLSIKNGSFRARPQMLRDQLGLLQSSQNAVS